MLTRRENYTDHLLRGISEALDIPPGKYEQAVKRYESVGKHIDRGTYPGITGEPSCYCQGSFRLGTVVRPLKEGKESDYDIDLVAQLPQAKENILPGELKQMIGDRLKEDARYKAMLDDEGKRCWTIQYAEEDGIGFHLDVLPSIPEDAEKRTRLIELFVPEHIGNTAIAITHKERTHGYQWKSSNPAGFAIWFQDVNRVGFEKIQLNERALIQEKYADIYARVEDVPDLVIRTPLQRVIQLLKRYRDIRFANHSQEKDKPISMIITTIAAKAYESNPAETLYETILHILKTLRQPGYGDLIKKENGEWYIPNPVNPEENFADKWHKNGDRKAKAFFMWLNWLEQDISQLINEVDIKKAGLFLSPLFGERVVSASLTGFENRFGNVTQEVATRPQVVMKNTAPSPWLNNANPR